MRQPRTPWLALLNWCYFGFECHHTRRLMGDVGCNLTISLVYMPGPAESCLFSAVCRRLALSSMLICSPVYHTRPESSGSMFDSTASTVNDNNALVTSPTVRHGNRGQSSSRPRLSPLQHLLSSSHALCRHCASYPDAILAHPADGLWSSFSAFI